MPILIQPPFSKSISTTSSGNRFQDTSPVKSYPKVAREAKIKTRSITSYMRSADLEKSGHRFKAILSNTPNSSP